MGGVHGAAAAIANAACNLIGACPPCHDDVDHDPDFAKSKGWLIPHPHDPTHLPAWLHTPNGVGWWLLLPDGDYQWIDPDDVHMPWEN